MVSTIAMSQADGLNEFTMSGAFAGWSPSYQITLAATQPTMVAAEFSHKGSIVDNFGSCLNQTNPLPKRLQ